MLFGPARAFITAILLSSLLASAGLSSAGNFEDEAPLSMSSSQETVTIDASDKEDTPPVSPQINIKKKKQQQAGFIKYFQQPSKIDYNVVKKEILEKPWPVSKNGNPVMYFSAYESPDHATHRIVITHWVDPNNLFETKYSAMIDGTSLGHWSTDQDSVKRAAITIIYK